MTRFVYIVALLVCGVANAQQTEIRVKNWPRDVPCFALKHQSDGTWMLADVVIGPDGTRHYPDPDPDSYDNRQFAKVIAPNCKTAYGTYKDHDQ